MIGDLTMPTACPGCQKTLYSTSASRPAPTTARMAKLLYLLAGTLTALIYLLGLGLLREWLKEPIGPALGNPDYIAYRVPPTLLLSAIALPVALVPGLAVGWLASRIPEVRRLRCWNCGWRQTFPVTATWGKPPPTRYPVRTPPPADLYIEADDEDAWKECTAWTWAALRTGRAPEDIEAELIAQGWPADDVAGMVERCRKETRASRP
jgi:hypothetical protein